MRFQQATLTDLALIFALMRQMQCDDPWSEPFEESIVRKSLADVLQNPAYGVIYVAHDEGAPVGYLVICFDFSLEYQGKGAWIDELFVVRSHRGQGIGMRFLELAEEVAAEHGAMFLHLEVTHGNPAIELYRRRGFADHHRYLMTKRLAE